MPGRPRLWLGGIVALGVGLRVLFYLWQGLLVTNDGLWDYLPLSRQLAQGWRYEETGSTGISRPTCYRLPGYPLFLAAFYQGGDVQLEWVIWAQMLLEGLSMGLTYLLARRVAGPKEGLLAAFLQAVSPLAIPAPTTLLSETLFTFTLLWGCYLLALERPKWWLLGGFVLGYAALIRPTSLYILLMCLTFSGLKPFRSHFKRFGLAMLSLIVVGLPWSIRCSLIYGRPLFLPSMGQGISLYDTTEPWAVCAGFRQKAEGEKVECPEMKSQASKLVEGLDKLGGDRRFGEVAFQRILADPLSWLKRRLLDYPTLLIHKGEYFWLISPKALTPLQQNPKFVALIKKICLIESYLRLIAMGLGLVWAWRRNRAVFVLVGLPLLSFLILYLPFWVEARYFVPLLPLSHIMAGYGLFQIVSLLIRRV